VNLYYLDGFRDNVIPSYPVADETDLWSDPNNWNTAMNGTGTYRVPVDGDFLVFGTNGLEYVKTDIDLDGNSVYLPNSSSNMNRLEFRIIDTVGGATLTLNVFAANYSGPHSIDVPLFAQLVKTNYRVGNMAFYKTVNTVAADFGNGNVRLQADVTVSNTAVFRSDGGVTVYLEPNSATPLTVPTLTTPVLDVMGASTQANMSGFVVCPQINIYEYGKYDAKIDGALGDANTNVAVTNDGYLKLSAAQTHLAHISVGAYGALAGNLTGAVYDSGDPNYNVTFNADAVLAPFTNSAGPTRAELGGATLWRGIERANTGTVYEVGDDANTGIYKGFAFGVYTTSADITKELKAAAGSGNLLGYIGRQMTAKAGNIFRGDGTSTTADIKFNNSGSLYLDVSLNNTDPTAADVIKTFNLTRDPGKERTQLLNFNNANGKILDNQTINVKGGMVNNTTNLTGGGLLGTLSITDGEFAQPGDQFDASDTGYLVASGRTAFTFNTATNQYYLEALGSRFTYSGYPLAALTSGTIEFDWSGGHPVTAAFLQNADYARYGNGSKTATLASDLYVGHGRFIVNTYDNTNMNSLATSDGNSIRYAGNAPTGQSPWIGFAAMGTDDNIKMDVYVPGAAVQVGTDDPNRLAYTAIGSFAGVIPANRVTFSNAVTAAGMTVKSGSVTIDTASKLVSGSSAAFPVTFSSVTSGATFRINNAGYDANNPVTIAMNAGRLDLTAFGGATDLGNTSIAINAGGYAQATSTGLTIKDLSIAEKYVQDSQGLRINDSGDTVIVTGTLSGNGGWGGNGGAIMKVQGTLAPGASVGELTGKTKLIMDDGAVYEWQVAKVPSDGGEAGTDWDLVRGSTIDFAGAFTLMIMADGSLDGDIAAEESFDIAIAGAAMTRTDWVTDVTFDYDEPGKWASSSPVLALSGDSKTLSLSGLVYSSGPVVVPGDTNEDGVVDAADYIAVKQNLGLTTGATLGQGNVDGDDDVDWDDLQLVMTNFGAGSGTAPPTTPEPATLGLLMFGAAALLRRNRRS
jgi:hypothetical protein